MQQDHVHPGRDAAVEPGIGAVAAQDVERVGPMRPVAWSTDGSAARAGLDRLQQRAAEAEAVDVILFERGDAVDHQVRAEAVHRQRIAAVRRQFPVQVVQRGLRNQQERVAVREARRHIRMRGPAGVGDAAGLRREAHQPAREAQRLAEPVRGRVAAVVGIDQVVPHSYLARISTQPEAGRASGSDSGANPSAAPAR